MVLAKAPGLWLGFSEAGLYTWVSDAYVCMPE